METKIEKIYDILIYGEQCSRAGEIVSNPAEWRDDGGELNSQDVWCWGHGTEEELVAWARKNLLLAGAARADNAYRRRCAENVLEYFGAA